MAKTLFDWKKTIFICVGLPGSGKSTLALQLVRGERSRVIENDDYWYVSAPNGISGTADTLGPLTHWVSGSSGWKYEYTAEMTHLAGEWCMAEAFRRLRIYDSVAVPNTFVYRKHLWGWVEQAKKLGVVIRIHRPQTPWANNPEECFRRNVHGVPLEVVQRMNDNREPVSQQEIDDFLFDR